MLRSKINTIFHGIFPPAFFLENRIPKPPSEVIGNDRIWKHFRYKILSIYCLAYYFKILFLEIFLVALWTTSIRPLSQFERDFAVHIGRIERRKHDVWHDKG